VTPGARLLAIIVLLFGCLASGARAEGLVDAVDELIDTQNREIGRAHV
jgi:hypothetical protein